MTPFSRLSEAAQDLIVSATVGEFDESGPPEIPDSVRQEIEEWIKQTAEDMKPFIEKPKP